MAVINVVPYNPDWPIIYEKESKLIKEALGDNCIEIHHIGSTSVPDLVAKPKIDMLAVVNSPSAALKQLEKIGIQYRGEYNIPLHCGFSKRGSVDINLHVYEKGHPEVDLNLLFRDYLRAHNQVRDEYAYLKKELLADESSFLKNNSAFPNYTLRKGDFIRKVLRRAGFNRLRMLKCNDETEWGAAKHFRQKYFFSPHGIDDPYTWTFNHPEHAHLILYQGTEIIGYAHIQFWPANRAAMRIIVIEEGKRNSRAGSAFLGWCEKWLKSMGINSLHAESRPTSLGFYTKNGYVEMPFNDPEGYESDPQDIAVGKAF
jgi:GrpB-like predicted nucleotidyltransferase (UPF0157 family)